MQLVWADGAYTHGLREWSEEEPGRWRVEVPYHRDRPAALALRARGEATTWVLGLGEEMGGGKDVCVVGSVALVQQRLRTSLPEMAETMIYGAMSRIMLRRLARAK